jgi:hypothetical protein
MNLNLGINPPQSKDEESLYQLAYNCAASQAAVKCNACKKCMYNITLYGWDLSQIKLIKARATMDYHHDIYNKQREKKAYWQAEFGIAAFTIVVILILALVLPYECDGLELPPPPYSPPKHAPAMIRYVKENIRDVNGDGKINCVDYSVVFYENWPHSSIIHVWDNSVGFDHLLILAEGKYVEPQTPTGNPEVLWGKMFATTHKRNRTEVYGVWATRKSW